MQLALAATAVLAALTAGTAAGCQTARSDLDSIPATGPGIESSTAQPPSAPDPVRASMTRPDPESQTAKQPTSAPTTDEAMGAAPNSGPGRGFGEVWKTSDDRLLGQWNWIPVWYKGAQTDDTDFPVIMAVDDTRLIIVRPYSFHEEVFAYVFDSTTGAVTMAAPSGIRRREIHTVVWTGRHALIGSGRHNHLWLTYDPSDDVWEELTVDPLPEPLDGLQLDYSVRWGRSKWRQPYGVWNGSEVLFLHESLSGLALDPYRGTWRTLAAGPLSPRQESSRVWTGRELVVWGGCDNVLAECSDGTGLEQFRDGAIYEPVTDTWRTMAPSPLPDATVAAAVWVGTETFYLTTHINTGVVGAASYNPASDEWTLLPAPPFSLFYGSNSLAWSSTSDLVLVWRGRHVSDGAAYDLSTKTWFQLPDAPNNTAVRKNAINRWSHSVAAIGNTFYIDGGSIRVGWGGGQPALGALTLSPHPRVYTRQE